MIRGTQITYIGHATILIEMDGARVLTDPLLRDRIGHLRRHGLRLGTPLRERIRRLNPNNRPAETLWYHTVDAVLISHLHWDHFDVPSLRMLGYGVRLIVPQGAAKQLRRRGFRRVEEVSPGDAFEIGSTTVDVMPAAHNGFRPPFGPITQCLGYVVRGAHRVYFPGDTDLFPEMTELAHELDVALVPIWGWGPALGSGHMDPRRAAEALTLLRPRIAVPIHWGTFYPLGLGLMRSGFITLPPYAFAHHAARLAPEVEVKIVEPGERFQLDG